MIDIKTMGHKAVRVMTSPTAFSWYGIAGVVATGIATFLATCKWKDIHKEGEELSGKEKLKEAAETALIFTPPVLVAAGTCYCIKHGNDAAMMTVDKLMDANTFLSKKTSRTTSAAVGVMAERMRSQLEKRNDERVCYDGNLLTGDPEEMDDHGKVVTFYDSFCERWFESTIFDVLRAEEEVHKFFNLRGYVSVAEFQAFLHLTPDNWTQLCGWDDNVGMRRGYFWIDFGHKRVATKDGEVYYEISYLTPPVFDEEFEWIMQDEDEWTMREGQELWVRS